MNKITKTIAGVIATFAFVAVFAASANAAYTRSLTVGSTGADVTELQTWLNSKGYLAVAPTGYFGNLTKAAVAAFQTANGITPAAGYFGPISQAKVASMGSTGGSTSTVAGCTAGALFSATTGAPCTGGSTGSTGSLAGTDGTISDVNELSTYNNEEVGEDTEDVKIAGFEVEASNDGDIAIKSIKVSFDPAGNASTDSDNLDDYITGVTVWQGDKKVGSADVEDFNEDDSNIFSRTISLSGSVVEADETEKFYITVDAASSLDSGDIDSDSWSVDVDSIRFEDGSGVVTTDTSTGDINAMDVDFLFVTFSTSADTELKISTDSSTPDAGIVIADDTDNTDNVSLLKGKIKLDGTSDVVLDELPVTFTVTGTAGSVSSTTGSVILKIDGEEYTESVSVATNGTAATITFDNLDLTIDAGSTISFEILADINDFDSVFVAGDTLKASVTASNRALIDAENEAGDQLTDSEKSGTATGEAQEFRTAGIMLTLISKSQSVSASDTAFGDVGTFTIKYKVKAVGDNVYISTLSDVQLTGNTTGYTTARAYKGNTATVTSVSTLIDNTEDDDLTSVGNYLIEEGDEEDFELTVRIASGDGLFSASIGGVMWSTTDISLPANSYTSNLDDFRTSSISLN